jgi:hypothetical protein
LDVVVLEEIREEKEKEDSANKRTRMFGQKKLSQDPFPGSQSWI